MKLTVMKTRIIRLPKPEYITLIQDDLRRSMKYDTTLKTSVNSNHTQAPVLNYLEYKKKEVFSPPF